MANKKSKIQTDMKTIVMTILILGFIFQQLSGQKKTDGKFLLTGQVFTSEVGLDKINCKYDTIAKDNYFVFLFFNDSTFIHIVYNCCPFDTMEFASESYFIGSYKIDNNILTLRYRLNGLTLYTKQSNKNINKVSSQIKVEKVDLTLYSLEIKKCKNILYLNNIETDDYICYVSGFGTETINSIKSRLESKNIWKRLLKI